MFSWEQAVISSGLDKTRTQRFHSDPQQVGVTQGWRTLGGTHSDCTGGVAKPSAEENRELFTDGEHRYLFA